MRKIWYLFTVLAVICVCILSFFSTKWIINKVDSFNSTGGVKAEASKEETSKGVAPEEINEEQEPINKTDKDAFQGNLDELRNSLSIPTEVEEVFSLLSDELVSVRQEYNEKQHAMMRVYTGNYCEILTYEVSDEILSVKSNKRALMVDNGYILEKEGEVGEYDTFSKAPSTVD